MLSSKMQEPGTSHSFQHKTSFGHTTTKPTGTMEYVASSQDTLRSVAVAFDTTTTRLMKLNRMSSLTIFPGQTLFVPCDSDEVHSPSSLSEHDETENTTHEAFDSSFTGEFSFLSPLSPSTSSPRPFKDLVMVSSSKPSSTDSNKNQLISESKRLTSAEKRRDYQHSHKQEGGADRNDLMKSLSHNSVSSSDRMRVMSGESTESEPFEEGFVKMDVHHITMTKEMVKGILLVTPTALMFDPEMDDPVFVRSGRKEYSILCQMDLINSIAMYNDISKMTPASPLSPVLEALSTENSVEEALSSASSATTTEAEAEINDLIEIENEIPDLPLDDAPVSPDGGTTSKSKLPWSPKHDNTLYEVKGPVPGMPKPANVTQNQTFVGETKDGVVESNGLKTNNAQSSECEADNHHKLENEFPFLHAIVKTVEDYLPGVDHSKSSTTKQPPHRPDSNHMYLCIQAQQAKLQTFSGEQCSKTPPNAPCENNEGRSPEYWFQVPRKRSDHLYAFFLQWSPANGLLDDVADSLGFVTVPEDICCVDGVNGIDANENNKRIRTLTNSSLEFVDDFFDESYSFEKEWEIISIQEAKRRSVCTNPIELAEADDSLIPELEKPSNLLTDSTLLSLCKNLPNRCVGYSWSPVYTTYDHGTSLRTLYRNMASVDAPVVLVIQDENDHIFGALCSDSLHMSDHYYGTGESFLFTISPHFETFKWSGENSFFIKGDTDSITLGGGKGTFGLWLDSDLYRGCSHPCDTYKNKILSSEEDFVIQAIEVWMIKDM